MIKAVLFDRDGVLIESENVHMDSVEMAFERLGIKISEEEKFSVVGSNPRDYVFKFLKKYSFNKDTFLKIQGELYDKHFPSTFRAIEPSVTIVGNLNKKGYSLGLVTSSSKESTDEMIKKLKLGGVFQIFVTVEEPKKRKPAPDPYLLALKKLNLNPEECIVVEDSSSGLKSAKAAGIKCIIIANKYTEGQDFTDADYKIEKPEEILSILDKLNTQNSI